VAMRYTNPPLLYVTGVVQLYSNVTHRVPTKLDRDRCADSSGYLITQPLKNKKTALTEPFSLSLFNNGENKGIALMGQHASAD